MPITLAQLVDSTDTFPSPVDTLTNSLIDAAVQFEQQAHVLADQNRVLRHDLQRELRHLADVQASAQSSLDRARRGIARIRRAHRTASHATVSRAIKQAFAELDATTPPKKGRITMTDAPEPEQIPLPFDRCPKCGQLPAATDFHVETCMFICAKCGRTWKPEPHR